MKKFSLRGCLLRLALAAAVAVALLLLALNYGLGWAVEKAAPQVGPAVLGTPLSVSNAHIRALSGRAALSGLVVGAPEGFDANVFEMSDFRLDVDVKSVFAPTNEPVVIREIVIDGPVVTYELKGLKDNLHAILEKVGADAEKPEAKEGGRKVCIDRFVFDNAKVRVAVAGGKGAVLPLPKIELEGIGSKSGGATALEAVAQILQSITVGTVKAVAGTVLDIGGAALEAAGALSGKAFGAADAAAGAVGDAAGAAAGAVGDAAGAAAGAVGDAAGAAAGAVGDAAKEAIGAIGSLFGSSGSDGKEESK